MNLIEIHVTLRKHFSLLYFLIIGCFVHEIPSKIEKVREAIDHLRYRDLQVQVGRYGIYTFRRKPPRWNSGTSNKMMLLDCKE